MPSIKELSPIEAQAAVVAMSTIEEVRAAALELGIPFSNNSRIASLKGKIVDFLDGGAEEGTDEVDLNGPSSNDLEDEPIQVAKINPKKAGLSTNDMIMMDPSKIEDVGLRRQVVRARALRMLRVRITNLDPQDAPLNGGIITVSNKYAGKVSKYIPYGEESANGYYVPKILLDHLEQVKFPLRKEKKGNRFGVKQYNTIMSKKFSIEYLPHLTKEEIAELAAQQRASHAIDNPTAA